MATNSNVSNSGKKKKIVKNHAIKTDRTKNQKKPKNNNNNNNNLYTAFKSGITEHSSEEEEEKDQPIKIYYKDKIATILIKTHEPFSNFINLIKEKFKIENFEKKFEIFFNHKEIPLTDGRIMAEIINNEEEQEEEDIIFELREKIIKNIGYKDKLYIELENVPSFMDLTTQISYFISLQKKEVDYELNYNNNIYNLLFSSNQIGFSFVSFMSNLKFTNKYYRKLKIDIHYNTIEKLRYESKNDKEKEKEKEKNIIKNKNKSKDKSSINLPYFNNRLSLFHNTKHKKSKSYGNLYNNISNDEYNINKNNNFINNSIPYEQEKLMKRIENARNKKKWMNIKGFFTSANIQSFNSLISPTVKIHKIKINNNNKKSKIIYLSKINNDD